MFQEIYLHFYFPPINFQFLFKAYYSYLLIPLTKQQSLLFPNSAMNIHFPLIYFLKPKIYFFHLIMKFDFIVQ